MCWQPSRHPEEKSLFMNGANTEEAEVEIGGGGLNPEASCYLNINAMLARSLMVAWHTHQP